MTPGERAVWAAVFAATWTKLSDERIRLMPNRSDETLAVEAADEAKAAVEALRETAKNTDFGADVREVIGLECGDFRIGDRVHTRGRAKSGEVRWGMMSADDGNTLMVLVDSTDSNRAAHTEWWSVGEVAEHFRENGDWVRFR